MYERAKDPDDFTLIVKYLQDINRDIIYQDLFRELLFNVENEFINARIIASWIKPIIDGDKRWITKIENAISKFIGKSFCR